jgi:hypothetical protein
MGLVFLVSGLVKVWEPVLFYWDAVPYTQLLGLGERTWSPAARAALLLGPFECGLGLALLCRYRPRVVLPVGAAVMAFFAGLTGYAWLKGVGGDCGCFGALVERTPGEAAVEDLAMLALLALAWWGERREPTSVRGWTWKAVALGTGLFLLVGAFRFVPEMDRLEESDLQPGVRLTGLRIQGSAVDLRRGEYLVELFSPGCHRCMEDVARLNQWVGVPGIPALVALHGESPDARQLSEFRQRTQPRYPIASISRTDFLRLTWRHGYPRLAHVRDGVIQRVWEYDHLPSLSELQALFDPENAREAPPR